MNQKITQVNTDILFPCPLNRPYRTGITDEKLDHIMRSGAGTQWDEEIVAAFFRARPLIRQISRGENGQHEIDWLQLS